MTATATDGTSGGQPTGTSEATANDGSGEASSAGLPSTTGETDSNGEDPTGADLNGEELYVAFCAACHGPEGEGGVLGYEIRHHTPEHFEWVLRNGRPGVEFEDSVMNPYPEAAISAESATRILDYLGSLPQPETGEALYLDYCGNCHGPTGTGGVSGKEITDKGFDDVSEKVRDGINLGDVGAQDMYMPPYDTDLVSDEELQLIVDFVTG